MCSPISAQSVARYLTTMLSSADGVFYVSQDADLDADTTGHVYYARDDAGRRALGMPRIDTHVYARENGWAITALAELAAVDADGAWRARAERAAEWIDAHRRGKDGLYAHGEHDRGGPYLGDTLAMAEAFAALGMRDRAVAALHAIDARFAAAGDAAGYLTAAPSSAAVLPPSRLVDENVAIARLATRLQAADPSLAAVADRAMHLLTSPTLLDARPLSPGVLLADRERGLPVVADDAADIRAELLREAAAWNRGDLDGFLDGYEHAPTTTMIGKEPLHGFAAIAAMYHAKYGDRARMGRLTFDELDIRPLGAGFAVAIGRWALARDAAAGGPVGGWFTLTLRKSRDGWRIILDHTSWKRVLGSAAGGRSTMLLSALWSPEVAHETSAYFTRAPSAAGAFLWGVAIIAVIAFVGALISSMRVTSESPPK